MKITRKQLKKIITEAINSIESEIISIPQTLMPKIKALINTSKDDQDSADQIANLIESFYDDLYQLEIDEGDLISVAVKSPIAEVMSNTDLLSFIQAFNLKVDPVMPVSVRSQESKDMRPEYTLASDDHSRVHFELPVSDFEEAPEYDYDDTSYYDERLGDYYSRR